MNQLNKSKYLHFDLSEGGQCRLIFVALEAQVEERRGPSRHCIVDLGAD